MIKKATYKAPLLLRNGHLNTIFPTLFRRLPPLHYVRERLELPDDDFIDLDWSKVGSRKTVLVLHGLEGSSDSLYIKGMIRAFNQANWDGVGMNFRGCSGEINRQLTSYHMGATADLKAIVTHLIEQHRYEELVIIGFSLGGNVVLKYMGEEGRNAPKAVRCAIAFSVPCDIPSTNVELAKWQNGIYLRRFMKSLNGKLEGKLEAYADQIVLPEDRLPRTFREYDDCYTGPIHGFKNAQHYWESCSSKNFVADIRVPTLLVNALDDSFLGEGCYPYHIAKNHSYFHLETPKDGGHVGFVAFNAQKRYWSEERALAFMENQK